MSKPQIDGIDAPTPSDEKGSYALFDEKDVEAKGDAQAPIFEQSSSVGTFIIATSGPTSGLIIEEIVTCS
jgi:hypothetical protein